MSEPDPPPPDDIDAKIAAMSPEERRRLRKKLMQLGTEAVEWMAWLAEDDKEKPPG